MNAIKWFKESWQKRGLIQTFQVTANTIFDLSFDWWNGTDTMGWVAADELDVTSSNRCYAGRYQASKARPLATLFRKLPWPADSVFVDFGSGKGRVLLLAAQLPVKRVVGVEFSPQLCGVARKNIETFRRKHPQIAPIEVVEADAAAYPIKDDENIFFMYNPFAAVVVEKVLRLIRQSLRRKPRPVSLIYNTPVAHDTIEQSRLFARCEKHLLGGTEFRLYQNRSSVTDLELTER